MNSLSQSVPLLSARPRESHSNSFPQSESDISILGISLIKHDRKLLQSLADGQRWTLILAGGLSEGLRVVENRIVSTMLLPRNTLGCDWRDTLQLLHRPSHCSSVLLVTSGPVDAFCAAFLEQGGYGILQSPMVETQATDLVRQACLYWKTSIAQPYKY